MIVKQYQTGPLEVNTYVLIDEKSKKAALIDVGGSIKMIMNNLEKDGIKAEFILNTHGHFDHIFGEHEAQKLYNLPIYIHPEDMILVDNFQAQLETWSMPHCETPTIENYLEDCQEIKLGELTIKVLHMPGHTPGGVGFLCENTLFSGDSLFCRSVGRTDLPFGNGEALVKSVKEKFMTLPDDTRVLPGHDCETTIGDERKYNIFLR